jgi:Zn-dependent peptidase ImmA (M78 family)
VVAKIKLSRGFAAEAERTAASLRQELGLRPHERLCAFHLCEHLRIRVAVAEQVEGLSADSLEILDHPSGKSWSAVTIPYHASQRTSYLIIHNQVHSPARQQSNVMHEVAHILQGHTLSAVDTGNGLPDYMRLYPEEQELEANCLGWTLLLPRAALLHKLSNGWDHAAIMEHYQVSAEMVRLRINSTGVLRQLGNSRY